MMCVAVERDALVIGLTLVPGLLSRNRFFALFEDPEVRRARRRAGMLLGIVRQLAGTHGHVEGVAIAPGAVGAWELRYRVPSMRVDRRTALTELELACVRYLAGRAGVPGFHATDDDRAAIDAALKWLAAGLRQEISVPGT
jgi:hypothetical protein